MNPVLEQLAGMVEDIVEEYADNYEFDAGDDDGHHVPDEWELALIRDALHGLTADPEFVAAFNAWQDEVRAADLKR